MHTLVCMRERERALECVRARGRGVRDAAGQREKQTPEEQGA